MNCVNMRTTLGIVVIAAMLLVSCDKQLWPKLSDNPQPFVVVYDSLGMTLLLDSKHKLDRFWLQRSVTYIDSLNEGIIPESTAIPFKGAFGLPFNTTYEEALTRFGEPNSYVYTLSDTGVFVTADWDFEDRTSLIHCQVLMQMCNGHCYHMGSQSAQA